MEAIAAHLFFFEKVAHRKESRPDSRAVSAALHGLAHSALPVWGASSVVSERLSYLLDETVLTV